MKTYIRIPKEDSYIARAYGAIWDKEKNKWYVPQSIPLTIFNRWIPLNIELVPSSNWYANLRSILTKDGWDTVRRYTYKKANYKCEICGGKGKDHPVEAHEVWEYDHINLLQVLVGTIALCPMCHKVKHIGLAASNGEFDKVKNHLCKVNKWDEQSADRYINEALYIFKQRSKEKWKVNIDWVFDTFGEISINRLSS